MAGKVLTTLDRNRALLARQLLLERSRLPLVRAVERVAGIQAQYAPSSYIGLWSRLERFGLNDLTRALEQRRVVQGTLLRSTIHLVSAGDYWAFALGSRSARQAAWLRFDRKRLSSSDLKAAAKEVRKELAGRVGGRDEMLMLARKRDPERPTHLWNGLSAWVDLVRAPPSGTWERRRADLYALANEWIGPPDVTPEKAVETLLSRYLRGFGPARLADAANWAGLSTADLEPAAERLTLRRFRDEEDRELIDLPRLPRPDGSTKVPPLLPSDLGRDAPRPRARDADPPGGLPATRLRHEDSALDPDVPRRRRRGRQVGGRAKQEEGDDHAPAVRTLARPGAPRASRGGGAPGSLHGAGRRVACGRGRRIGELDRPARSAAAAESFTSDDFRSASRYQT